MTADAVSETLGDVVPTRFHHLGLAVRKPEKALRFLSLLGYRIGDDILDPLQGTHLIFCEANDMPAVEVIYPAEEGGGPLEGLLSRRTELIYHVCYEIGALDPFMTHLRARGVRITTVAAPKPAVLFGGQMVSFHMVPGFGLIEVLETPDPFQPASPSD